jgi:hypothetical protein
MSDHEVTPDGYGSRLDADFRRLRNAMNVPWATDVDMVEWRLVAGVRQAVAVIEVTTYHDEGVGAREDVRAKVLDRCYNQSAKAIELLTLGIRLWCRPYLAFVGENEELIRNEGISIYCFAYPQNGWARVDLATYAKWLGRLHRVGPTDRATMIQLQSELTRADRVPAETEENDDEREEAETEN